MDQYSLVHEHFSQGSKDPVEVESRMKDAEMHLGKPRVGETRMGKLYNYVRLQQIAEKVE